MGIKVCDDQIKVIHSKEAHLLIELQAPISYEAQLEFRSVLWSLELLSVKTRLGEFMISSDFLTCR